MHPLGLLTVSELLNPERFSLVLTEVIPFQMLNLYNNPLIFIHRIFQLL